MDTIRLSVALILLLVSLGCGKKDAAPATKESKPKDSSGTPTLPTSLANTGASSAAALKAATEFVKSVQDGKATSALLTPELKRLIAPPELDADKAVGFSEHNIQSWLISAKAIVSTGDAKTDFATSDYAIVSMAGKPGTSRLRMLRRENTWLVDMALLNNMTPNFPMPSGDAAGPAFGALAFASALQGGNLNQVEWHLSKAVKAKIAPPLFDSDKDRGYSQSKLKSALNDLFGFPVEIAKFAVSGTSASFEVKGTGPKKMIEFKLVPGSTPGEFLIDDLQQK